MCIRDRVEEVPDEVVDVVVGGAVVVLGAVVAGVLVVRQVYMGVSP